MSSEESENTGSLRPRNSLSLYSNSDCMPEFTRIRRASRTLIYLKYESQSQLDGAASDSVDANIVHFEDYAAGYEEGYVSARDDTFYAPDSSEFDLGKYFARPVRIAILPWTVGTAFPGSRLQVFQRYWTNKHVVNRLTTYRNLKCDMCVKIVVNGTPFHYGMLMASALPDKRDDDFLNTNTTELGAVRGSQNPHILIDPTSSSAGCLRLPYSNKDNAYTVTGTSLVVAGEVAIREVVPLAHVSGVIEPVTISVFAWAENVVLGAPTSVAATGLVAQSGDEYGKGVISRPAFILASLANNLSKVPYIAPYALASEMTVRGIGNLAQLFGYVKPNIVSDISYNKPRLLPNFASATQHDPIYKSTFDDKSEVTVDPRVVGITGRDEMGIVDIAKRESYLTQFLFAQTTPVDTRLFAIRVSPCMFRTNGTGINTQYHLTPMAWVSAPFQFWRGTLRYKFTAVCSSFHRGRIRILYEPGATATGVAPEYNAVQSLVWDIAKEKEVVVDVGWNQEEAYSVNRTIETAPIPFIAGPTGDVGIGAAAVSQNGVLVLYVENELTAPDTNLTSPISVMVTVSATDDFEVFSPTGFINNLSYFPQSGDTRTDVVLSPKANTAHITFGPRLTGDKSAIIFHGDPIVSLRTLLKRYTWSGTWGPIFIALGIQRYNWKLRLPGFPLYNGRAPSAVQLAGAPFNFTSMTFLNYFTPAFLARRGSVRHRFVAGFGPTYEHTVVERSVTSTFFNSVAQIPAYTTPSSISSAAVRNRQEVIGHAGGSSVTDFGEQALDIEIPYHSKHRYLPARTGNSAVPISGNAAVTLLTKFVTNVGSDVSVDHYVSAGDDFSLSYFVDIPIMYVHPVATLPAAT